MPSWRRLPHSQNQPRKPVIPVKNNPFTHAQGRGAAPWIRTPRDCDRTCTCDPMWRQHTLPVAATRPPTCRHAWLIHTRYVCVLGAMLCTQSNTHTCGTVCDTLANTLLMLRAHRTTTGTHGGDRCLTYAGHHSRAAQPLSADTQPHSTWCTGQLELAQLHTAPHTE